MMENNLTPLEEIEQLIINSDTPDEIQDKILEIIQKSNTLVLKTIGELNDYHFTVPSYQRGYKWKKQQVEDLLNDIDDFSKGQNEGGEFYCLQPVVVKQFTIIKENEDKCGPKKDLNGWELIDGQQRLTTIFMILKYLNSINNGKISYNIDYKTRNDESADFLQNITTAETGNNIDTFHFKQAYDVIQNWFKEKTDEDKEKWLDTLLNHTKIIWYHMREQKNKEEDQKEDQKEKKNEEIDLFMRINSGKIPLTNSELIRALFLHNSKNSTNQELSFMQQSKIANEWDYIEQQLHDDNFWAFITLNNPFRKDYPNRIEYLFDLIEEKKEESKIDEKYSTFRMYSNILKEDNGKNNVISQWQEIKLLYYRFHEWFIDDDLYHLIGYVRLCLPNEEPFKMKKLIVLADEKRQSELIQLLKDSIKKYLKNKNLDELSYGENNGEIVKILTLFNIYTHMKEKTRCPFVYYKKEQWSLEHIHAQNSQELNNEEWIKWANEQSQYSTELQNILNDWEKGNKEKIKKDFYKILDSSVEKDAIGNLALLGKSANSALGNMIYPNKRKKVLDFIANGKYSVPIATRNVFLKYYTPKPEQFLKWDENDADSYKKVIKNSIEEITKEG